MKIVAFNGSPKKDGNTAYAISLVLNELREKGIETEVVEVGNKKIRGCLSCGGCAKNRDEKCVISDDDVNLWIQKMKSADGVIFGSPVYYSAMAGTMKAFMDRAFYVMGVNGGMMRHKVGTAVVAVRRSGGLPTFNQLNNYLNYSEMVIPTSNYWNVIHGTIPGDAVNDPEGKQIMRVLGRNMAWLMQSLDHSKNQVEKPETEGKIYTHFVR